MSYHNSPQKQVFCIGIGGIGVSAIARYFASQNWAVSGSDMTESTITQKLQEEGIQVKIGHKKEHMSPAYDLVIFSNATPGDNIELLEARRLGIPTQSYPEAVGKLTEQYKTIAVAGSHGKSTTTALLARTLINGGFDPTVIVGTNLTELDNTNFRYGKGDYLILEADEFKRAFLNYFPTLLIITNIDREHLDIYNDLDDIKQTFLTLIGQVRINGVLMLNKDNETLHSLKSDISQIAEARSLSIRWYSLTDDITQAVAQQIQIPGNHNLSNALAAYYAARAVGINPEEAITHITSFKGAWRRMELRGHTPEPQQALVYDDYAHHPTEVAAALQGVRSLHPDRHIICVFQPHQAQRMKHLFREFTKAFNDADTVILLPIYKVAGRDELNATQTSEALAHALATRSTHHNISYLPSPEQIRDAVYAEMTHITQPAVIVMMGAGNIVTYTNSLLSST